MSLSFPSAYHGTAGSKWCCSLISHTAGRKQAPEQGDEIIVMLPPALGKEAIMNDTIVAMTANLCCLVSKSIPTLSLPENVLLNFPSSYIYYNMHRTSESVSRSEMLHDPVQFKPCLPDIIVTFNQP